MDQPKEWYEKQACGPEFLDITAGPTHDTDTPAPTASPEAPITAAELDWWQECLDLPCTTLSENIQRRLVAALRSERAERDKDAAAIVDFAKHCERGSLLDTHATVIKAAKERVKKCTG